MNCALHFLSEDLREQPIFPVEPKDKLTGSEVDRQQAFRNRLHIIAPEVISWGVPNAGKRGLKAQRQSKREGLTAGVHDEHYAWNHAYVVLEWKDGKGSLSQAQIDWGNAMVRRGFRVACVRTPEFAEQLFREWGAPFITRENRL
ncbi:hypothetical protein [Sphingomonas sp.]|uniref:hypothetical protein n=1 Tax=Sphingomonas sp. TaxID=28214 RepID=UPI002FDA3EFF